MNFPAREHLEPSMKPSIRRAREQHLLLAQRREAELQKAEEARARARFYSRGNTAKLHQVWTTEEYYDRAEKGAKLYVDNRKKAAQLEERRNKLELMLFEENLEFQQELKDLAAKPKLYKNGSFFNTPPSAIIGDVNQGIRDKEDELKKQEASLRMFHSQHSGPPGASSADRLRRGTLKTAWMEQVVEKETQDKLEEEATKRALKERGEYLETQIKREEDALKEKEKETEELKTRLERRVTELSQADSAAGSLRGREDRLTALLKQLRLILEERQRAHSALASESGTTLVNNALHRYRLRLRAAHVQKEIDLELNILDKLAATVNEQEECEWGAERVRGARGEVRAGAERERQRRQLIDSMLDGEARLIVDKQTRLWERERQDRFALMEDLTTTLIKRCEERIEANREQQRRSVLEREGMLDDIDAVNNELREKEIEQHELVTNGSNIKSLQTELNNLQLERAKLQETSNSAGKT